MINRVLCILIGYLFGNILTAEIIAYIFTGHSSSTIGTTGNPGMANMTAHVGMGAGILTLIGDVGKTILAMVICLYVCDLGKIGMFYGGLGTTLGHNFPVWRHFKGGKGVATTCTTLILLMPVGGTLPALLGLLLILITHYLCIGAVVIPLVAIIPAYLSYSIEGLVITAILTLLALYKNKEALSEIGRGTAERNDVVGGLKKKIESHHH